VRRRRDDARADPDRGALSQATHHVDLDVEVSAMRLFLLGPANAVCDRLGITDEHERGMMRMLVNMIIFTGVVVTVFFFVWRVFV